MSTWHFKGFYKQLFPPQSHISCLAIPFHMHSLAIKLNGLTHWGRVMHICVSKLTDICSDNGLSPARRQAIIWSNAGILLIRSIGTKFSKSLNKIHTFWFKKMQLKMSFAKWRPFCLGLNVLKDRCSPAVLPPSFLRHHCRMLPVNTLRPRQNGRHLADNTFKCISLNENVRFSITISLNFVPMGDFDNIPALV